MAKIIDKNGNIIRQDDQVCLYAITDLLDENGLEWQEWDYLSNLVRTMAGDSATAFNTVKEMISEIPGILDCSEENVFLCVFSDSIDWFILGWGNEDNAEVCNKVLKTYFSEYSVIAD